MSKTSKPDITDVCIIGSGAGGAVAAKELAERGLSVVVLETGKRFNAIKDFTIATSNDWERLINDYKKKFDSPKIGKLTLSNSENFRPDVVYGVGGGTLRYLAYLIRLLPDDFRTYTVDGVGIDWPISYEDLVPYYQEVEAELGVSGNSNDPWFPSIKEYPNPHFDFSYSTKVFKKSFDQLGIRLWYRSSGRLSRPFDGRPACVHCGQCILGCMVNAKSSTLVTYIPKAESTGNAIIYSECSASRIKVNSQGKAESVIYHDKNDKENEIKAKVIIVSAGAIQSPRILLNSKSSLFPDGLANSSGMVGKNYMQHLSINSTAIFPERFDAFRGYGGAATFDFAKTDRKNSHTRGYYIAVKTHRRGPARSAIDGPGWGKHHKDYMRNNFGHIAGLSTSGEMLPDTLNSIDLNPNVVDYYGMPAARINFKLGNNEKMMLKSMQMKLHEIYSTANVRKILKMEYNPGSDAHNMGTCRMGNNPDTSVLNSYCQSHDVRNLFVVDASCFVTSGTSNPSLTIMAIAKRSAEYIAREGQKGNL